jgi:RimJ/RimL family protein N-acetyltransferase
MNIVGEKVLLRAIEYTDKDVLLNLINDPNVESMVMGWSFPVSSDQQAKWLERINEDKNTLRVIIEAEHTAIGTAVLSNIDYKNGSAEIHIKMLLEKYGNKGYGTDTIKTLLKYAFSELRLHSIYALVCEHNDISRRLFANCGFVCEGTMRERLFKNGGYVNVMMYSIINQA